MAPWYCLYTHCTQASFDDTAPECNMVLSLRGLNMLQVIHFCLTTSNDQVRWGLCHCNDRVRWGLWHCNDQVRWGLWMSRWACPLKRPGWETPTNQHTQSPDNVVRNYAVILRPGPTHPLNTMDISIFYSQPNVLDSETQADQILTKLWRQWWTLANGF